VPLRAPRFPDAVAVVNTYLRAALVAAGRPVAVTGSVPDPIPAELVKVSRTGGPKVLPVVDGAQITVDCWSTSQTGAASLAELARQLIDHAQGTVQSGVPIHRVVDVGGPQDVLDPANSGKPKAYFTVQFQIRGVAA
jgi:hypothetical protein